MAEMQKQVTFTQMKDGTFDDYQMLHTLEEPYHRGTAARLLAELARQGQETLEGYKITRLEHALQSATRARRDGAESDRVVAALLHDIGDGLAPQNHDKFAAEILRPFMRDEIVWVVEHHGIFQMVYYAHHLGWDRELRQQFAGNPYYQTCVDFCERWDQSSFDPDYPMDPLDSFKAEVEAVFARKAWDKDVAQVGVALGLPPATA